ncbi:MAG: hypothetical protein ACI4VF_04200 [Lachnospirales bacterium]
MGKYDDIINLEYVKSKRHKQMSITDRAAQFSPFAALTGHKEAIEETARYTDTKPILDDDVREKIGNTLLEIKYNIKLKPEVEVEYFIEDEIKCGGSFKNIKGRVIKIDEYKSFITVDNVKIKFNDILNIEIIKSNCYN